MQGNYVKLLHLKTVSRENVTDEPRLEALRARIPHTNFHSMSSLKERGRVKRGFTGFCPCFGGVRGHAGLARGPAAQPGAVVCPVSRLLPIRVSGPCGSKDRAQPGRRSRRRQASLTLRAAIR